MEHTSPTYHKPGTNDYCPVQDLREINKRVETIHPMVPNPYTLLSLLPPSHQVYTVLDLKDAFFSLPLAEVSQPIFALEWTDPEEGLSGQLTWTRLPQGFKNSPTLSDEALSQDLLAFRAEHPGIVLLQYVDDLLLAAETKTDCREATEDLLKGLGDKEYRVSAKKAQFCTPWLLDLTQEKWTLSKGRSEAILKILPPRTKRQVREFLGAVGYCWLWIPGFSEIAKPLYTSTRGENAPPRMDRDRTTSFEKLKQALVSGYLALPDIQKPFYLYVAEVRGIAKGMLAQTLGPWKRLIAYLSKRLDLVTAGWPICLGAIATMAILVKEANKLTLGQELHLVAPHAVDALLKALPHRWMTNAPVIQY
jgi:hypothetical protein